jgi:methionyl-tRNA formyltransferase
LPTLAALAGSPHTLVGVLTQPDRPAGRGRQLTASPVKRAALELGLPIAQPARLSTAEQREELSRWRPDLLVVVAYGVLLPPEVLSLPRLGCVNLHASLLPRWRGAAPIQRAILAGDAVTGVSLMQMDAGLDTGAVLATLSMPIGPHESAGALAERLAAAGAGLLSENLAALEQGRLAARPQSTRDASYAPKLDKKLALLTWGLTAGEIDRQIRAFNPWPVAHTTWEGQLLRVWQARIAEPAELARAMQQLPATAAAVPGTILGALGEELLVLCGEGALCLEQVQLAGRRVVSAREFAVASHPVGARLGA